MIGIKIAMTAALYWLIIILMVKTKLIEGKEPEGWHNAIGLSLLVSGALFFVGLVWWVWTWM